MNSIANWINHPINLQGEIVILAPLDEKYFDEISNTSQDEKIWTYMPVKGTDKGKIISILEEAIGKRVQHEQYPFVVIEKKTKKIIGCTRYLQINQEHRNLEIGYTWYLPEYWGKGYNEECKLLLLTHCFDVLKTIRVQLIAWDKNMRSRRAIERIGATFEGILRNVVVRQGEKRSVAYFSIIEEEWENVKRNLTELVKKKYDHHN